MRCQLIEGHRQQWPTRLMCQVPEVSAGGYYRWRRQPRGRHQRRREAPAAEIKSIHQEVEARYGGPRIHAGPVARGEPRRVNAAVKPMRQHGVVAKARRKSRRTTDSNHDRPVAEDVVGRKSEPGAPDRARTADITYIPTREGWPHPAAVEDLHSRQVVGWSTSGRIDGRLVVDASGMAISRRPPGDDPVAYSDRGGQYASEHRRRSLPGHGITCGMGRRASRWDDAPTESFFASPKKGLVHDEGHTTRAEARSSIFEYIEFSHDRVRRHASLGYRPPPSASEPDHR